MSDSTASPPPPDDLSAAFELAIRLLKERRHVGFDELAGVLKSHGYPIAGDLPYIYRQDSCLVAWVGMSRLFWMVASSCADIAAFGSSGPRISDLPNIRPICGYPSRATTLFPLPNPTGYHANWYGVATHNRPG